MGPFWDIEIGLFMMLIVDFSNILVEFFIFYHIKMVSQMPTNCKDAKVTTPKKRLVSIFDDVTPRFATSWKFFGRHNFRSREKNCDCFLYVAMKFRNTTDVKIFFISILNYP